jgi:ABC-2 type transport system permease protein
MTGVRAVWLVVRREWNQRVRSNAFRISTLIAAAIVVAIIISPQLLGGNVKPSRTVALVGRTSPELPTMIATIGDQLGLEVSTQRAADRGDADAALRAGDVNVVLVDQRAVVWKAEADDQLLAVVTTSVQAAERQRVIGALDLTSDELRSLRPSELTSSSLEAATAERSARLDVAMIGLSLLLLAISFYGGFLLVGVIEEKSSRVIEVLLSRLRPTDLLSGKIAGIGLVGLAQVGVVAVAALGALAVSDNADVPATTASTVAWLVLWFVLGYGFYAVLYGAAGSLVSRQEEAQSMTLPISGVLLVAYFFAMDAARSPDSTAALIGSFLPPTAPMVMLARVAYGGVPAWQIAVSVVLMVAAIVAMLRIAGRVYAGAALRSGRRVKLREAWYGVETTR